MNIKIYQINLSKDKNRVCFLPLDMLEKLQGSSKIDPALYDLVYSGDVVALDLEDVYSIFNTYVNGYAGRSLSISDVIEVIEDGDSRFFYCDSVGFQEIKFLKEER